MDPNEHPYLKRMGSGGSLFELYGHKVVLVRQSLPQACQLVLMRRGYAHGFKGFKGLRGLRGLRGVGLKEFKEFERFRNNPY